MLRKSMKIAICAFIIGIIIGASSAVIASSAQGPKRYYSVYGINYYNQSDVIKTSSNIMYGGIRAHSLSGTVPAGYIGIKPRLYRNGALFREAQYYWYNPTPVTGLYTETPYSTNNPSGEYYGYGLSRAYHGNGYYTYTSLRSPSINR